MIRNEQLNLFDWSKHHCWQCQVYDPKIFTLQQMCKKCQYEASLDWNYTVNIMEMINGD